MLRAIAAILVLGLPLFGQTAVSGQPAGRVINAAGQIGAVSGDTPRAPAVAPAVSSEDKCSVEGTVVNALTGEPLKKVHLALRPFGARNGAPYAAITDSSGHFSFEGVDPGRYSFSAARNLYLNQSYSQQGDIKHSTPLILGNGQHLKDISFKLWPEGVIAGRILDENGEPLENVTVQCMRYIYRRGQRQLQPVNGSSTNDLGEFRMHGLNPGKYIISADYRQPEILFVVSGRPVDLQETRTPEEEYAVTYFPNTTDPGSASQIVVAPGAQVQGITITLAPTHAVWIKGRLSGAPAGAARRTMVFLYAHGGPATQEKAARIDANGSFEMRGVTPGSYILRASYQSGKQRYTATYPLDVGDSNIEGMELNLQPPSELSGKVIVEGNSDISGATTAVSLQSKTSGPVIDNSSAKLNRDLTFHLANIGQDPYDVLLEGFPQEFYVKSVRLGEQDVTDTGLDFTQNAPAAELTIVVNPNGGELDGTVQNAQGDPAPRVPVTLIPDASHRAADPLYKTARTDHDGKFAIKGIRPGSYTVYAWDEIDPGAVQDPDFLKSYESQGHAVTLKEGDRQNVQLKTIPADSGASPAASN